MILIWSGTNITKNKLRYLDSVATLVTDLLCANSMTRQHPPLFNPSPYIDVAFKIIMPLIAYVKGQSPSYNQ